MLLMLALQLQIDPATISAIVAILVPVGYILGVGAAILWPYLNAKKDNPAIEFDWRYATWQIVFGIVGFVPTLLASNTLSQFDAWAGQGWIGIPLAMVAGFGAARAGRETQKTKEVRQ